MPKIPWLPAARSIPRSFAGFVDPLEADGSRIRVCHDPRDALRIQGRVGSLTAASLGDYDWREPLEQLQVRTLVIHQDADPIPLDSARE